MDDAKTTKTTDLVTKKTKDQFTVMDILKNNTRFMIHGYLSIYNELSLKELSELSGKPKNSLFDHLHIMVEGGIIEISREERVRGKNTRKFYSLVADADKKTKYIGVTKENHYSPENLSAKISLLKTFSQTKISMHSKWIQYLEEMQKNLDNGQIDEVKETFKEIWEKWENFNTVSYYSNDVAQSFIKKSHTLYRELEEETRKEAESEHDGTSSEQFQSGIIRKQFWASITLIPIERLLTSLTKKPKGQKKKDSPPPPA